MESSVTEGLINGLNQQKNMSQAKDKGFKVKSLSPASKTWVPTGLLAISGIP